MGRTICICGSVPAEDEHSCPVAALVEQQIEAEKAGDEERAQKLEREIVAWEERF